MMDTTTPVKKFVENPTAMQLYCQWIVTSQNKSSLLPWEEKRPYFCVSIVSLKFSFDVIRTRDNIPAVWKQIDMSLAMSYV